MHPIINRIADCGQSIWYDNISRGMFASGALQALVDDGVVGVTSNPTIFHKSVSESTDYDAAMREHVESGDSAWEIYDALTRADIAAAADLFREVYDRTDGRDGFVSIEVSPKLAYDTDATIEEARRLFRALDRPNVMIKIPGTQEGIPAFQQAISEGINVNVTLIFSTRVYERVMAAYIEGITQRADAGKDVSKVASVASFFVSRVDTSVDKQLDERIENGESKLRALLGRAAVANCKLAYQKYLETFTGSRFAPLKKAGARVQRPLWASTSTKNPSYPPTLYVDTLIGEDTVNTVPHVTLDAIRGGGMSVESTLTQDPDEARNVVNRLASIGIDMDTVTADLRTAGVKAFANSFDALLADIETRRQTLASA